MTGETRRLAERRLAERAGGGGGGCSDRRFVRGETGGGMLEVLGDFSPPVSGSILDLNSVRISISSSLSYAPEKSFTIYLEAKRQ